MTRPFTSGGAEWMLAEMWVITKRRNWRECLGRLFKLSELFPICWLIILYLIIFGLVTCLIAYGKIRSVSISWVGVLVFSELLEFPPLDLDL